MKHSNYLFRRDLLKRTLVGLALLVTIVTMSSCSALPKDEESLLRELPTIPLRSQAVTYEVERVDLAVEVRGTAIVTPTLETELYFREPGRLTVLYANVRETVTEGQVLARLESSELEHQLKLAEIDLEISRLRYQALKYDNIPRADQAIDELQLLKKEIHTTYLRDRVSAYVIHAPHDGYIKMIRGKVGELVQEYKTIIEVSDPTELELQMYVPVDDFQRIKIGQPALIEIIRDSWAPGIVAKVTMRNQATNPAIHRDEYIVHLELEDSSIDLRAQARLTATVVIESRLQTLVIPAAGLREYRERTYVRVLEGLQRREVDVKVGVRTETEIEILSGLEPGQLVISR